MSSGYSDNLSSADWDEKPPSPQWDSAIVFLPSNPSPSPFTAVMGGCSLSFASEISGRPIFLCRFATLLEAEEGPIKVTFSLPQRADSPIWGKKAYHTFERVKSESRWHINSEYTVVYARAWIRQHEKLRGTRTFVLRSQAEPSSLTKGFPFLTQGDSGSCLATIRVPVLPKMSKDIFECYGGPGPIRRSVLESFSFLWKTLRDNQDHTVG